MENSTEKWIKVSDSLIDTLITFCFQELTFGSKFGYWDNNLSDYFKSGKAKIMKIWEGQYVWGEKYMFYLMNDNILVGDFDGDFFLGANNENEIALITKT